MQFAVNLNHPEYAIEGITLGPFQTNCYLLKQLTTKQCWLFDAGFEADKIIAMIRDSNFALQEVILTHGHIDHIAGVDQVKQAFDVQYAMHPDDEYMTTSLEQQGRLFGLNVQNVSAVDRSLQEETTSIAGLEVQQLHTPGHSPGSISFYFPQLNVCIAGDTLFRFSIGRTDLPGGNHAQLIQMINEKLLTLPEDTVVLPGHMGPTQIGAEKLHNPFLQ